MEDLGAVAERLGDEVARALPAWVVARGGTDDVVREVLGLVMDDLRAALSRDVDEPGPSPLSIVRRGVGPVTVALRHAGVEPPPRDPEQVRLFPEDVYDIAPASFADLSPAAGDAGIAWGAARAFTHLQRRRT